MDFWMGTVMGNTFFDPRRTRRGAENIFLSTEDTERHGEHLF